MSTRRLNGGLIGYSNPARVFNTSGAYDIKALGYYKTQSTWPISATDKAIFAYGASQDETSMYSLSNLVSNIGVVSTDVTGVGTARQIITATRYGLDKAIFGFGYTAAGGSGVNAAMTNLVSNTGVVANDVTGVGTARYGAAAAGYGTDKGIFGFGSTGVIAVSTTNLVTNTGVVSNDVTGVGTVRKLTAAASY
jgi:hypothetical protein